jgi:uncharacterized protein GlcG (DUF336 family)
MSVNLNRTVVATFLASCALTTSLGAQPLMQPNISAAQARQILDAAITQCNPPGDMITVTIVIVDRAGESVMEIRGDTASPFNREIAFRKAYTALAFRRTSLEWRDRTAGSDREWQRQLANVIPLGGGAPIMIGDDAIGAVGVSGIAGGQPAEDECARAGVAAIADQLR